VILDRNKLAEGKKFCKALGTTVSSNGSLMGYRMDDQGDENYCLRP
jgi:oligopeptidase B